ncbi:MAG: hypothetical protein KAT35_00875, partial [Candidatus Aenigmarchaeota archaeon]|nr:hypothetical protein [Candidatus Aenigmarchaeota archaeon]
YNVTMWTNYTYYYENTTIKPDIFYLTTSPILQGGNVTPRSAAWGTPFNFTINISDNLGDTVNVTLQYQILGQGWTDHTMQSCTNCSDNGGLNYTQLNWTLYLPCQNYAGQYMKFRFNATDTEGNMKLSDPINPGQYVGDSDLFGIEKANASIIYISGNFSIATLTQAAVFLVQVRDDDNWTTSFSQDEYPLVMFNVTTDQSSYAYVNESYTNDTGYSNVSFVPTPQFQNGTQYWKAYIPESDSCYFPTNTTNYTVIIDVNFPPLYDNETVRGVTSGASGGWGENWTFNITVRDIEGDDLNVSLQIDTGSGYQTIENQSCQDCLSWTTLNFTTTFDCASINSSAAYRFQVYDNYSSPNMNETAPHTFTIETDDINFTVIQGDSSTANRSGTQNDTLIILVNDTDRNVSVESGVNGTIWITTAGGITWDSGYNVTTNSSGHWTYDFNATCDYEVGEQTWRFKSVDSCYDLVDSFYDKSETYSLTVMGELSFTLNLPREQNYTEGDNVYFFGKLEDDCDSLLTGFESDIIFRPWNSQFEYLLTSVAEGGGFYSRYWSTSGNKPGGWYNITVNVTEKDPNTFYPHEKNFYYPNVTEPLHAFYLDIYPRLTEANVTPRQDGWSCFRNFTINVSDEDEDTVTVYLWQKVSGGEWEQIGSSDQCTGCDNYTMNWSDSYTCADLTGDTTTMNFKFNSSDGTLDYTTSVVSGDYVDDDDSFILEKQDVILEHFYGDEVSVNRTGTGTSIPLTLTVNDTDRDQAAYSPSATTVFNITTDGEGPGFLLDGSNTTNSSGQVAYHFNPNCSYSVGKQFWQGYTDDGCYKTNQSGFFNVTVIGNILTSASAENSSYNQEDNITVWINVTDDCGNFISVSFINVTIRYNDTVAYNCTNMYEWGTGNYSCNWTTTKQDPTGYYDLVVDTSNPPYYNNATDEVIDDFLLLSYTNNNPFLTNENVVPDGWGALTNFSVDVEDPDNDNVTVWLWEADSPGGPYSLTDNQTCVECIAEETLNFSVYHTCQDAQALKYYKFNASDGQGGTAATSSHSFQIEKDNVTITVEYGSTSYVNRSGDQVSTPVIIRIYDSDNQTYVGVDVNSSLFVAYNGTNYDSGLDNTTNSSGHSVFYFNPDCGYTVGDRNWIAGTDGDQCYDDETSSPPDIMRISGDMIINFTNISCPGVGFCFDGDNVSVRLNVSDECSNLLNESTVILNFTHDSYNAECTPVNDENDGYYNCTWEVTLGPGGWYSAHARSSK